MTAMSNTNPVSEICDPSPMPRIPECLDSPIWKLHAPRIRMDPASPTSPFVASRSKLDCRKPDTRVLLDVDVQHNMHLKVGYPLRLHQAA